MSPEEQAKKIEEIYNEAIDKIKELDKERQAIISSYIKKLENEKIEAIKRSINSSNQS